RNVNSAGPSASGAVAVELHAPSARDAIVSPATTAPRLRVFMGVSSSSGRVDAVRGCQAGGIFLRSATKWRVGRASAHRAGVGGSAYAGWMQTTRSVRPFEVVSEYMPAGDQPQAIAELAARINAGETDVVLLGATGTGKSATTAWLIEQVQRPTLVMAHNKT